MDTETKARQEVRIKTWLGKLFVVGILVILAAGLLRTVFFPKQINGYENRYANQIPSLTWTGVLDGTFQDGVEGALLDQVQLAQGMKSQYNHWKTGCLAGILQGVSQLAGLDGEQYIAFQTLRLYGDGYIVNWTRTLEMEQADLDRKVAALNESFANHPELNFFVYYIEKDTDLDFETGEKSGLSEYLLDRLELPEEQKACYGIDSFEEFSQRFYRTDTHWNHIGSYEGYCQLVQLLGCGGEVLRPTGEAVKIRDDFSGVKASSIGADGVLVEPFYAYPYVFPEMTVTINGEPADDYGNQSIYLSGLATAELTYGNFYGGDNGETVFSTGTQGRGSILVLGESFDNAVLKLLASHYDCLYSVDLRYYQHSMGQDFDLTAYTQAHGISNVLLMGNIDYFVQDDFDPEG